MSISGIMPGRYWSNLYWRLKHKGGQGARRCRPAMGFVNIRSRPYIAEIMPFDLSDDEKLGLIALLTRTIANDHYPFSPRGSHHEGHSCQAPARANPRALCRRRRFMRHREQQPPGDEALAD